jgi:hypothetical protein
MSIFFCFAQQCIWLWLLPTCRMTPATPLSSGSASVPLYTPSASLLAAVASAIWRPASTGQPASLLVATTRLSPASAHCRAPPLSLRLAGIAGGVAGYLQTGQKLLHMQAVAAPQSLEGL